MPDYLQAFRVGYWAKIACFKEFTMVSARARLVVCFAFVFLGFDGVAEALPVFPGAIGFGSDTPAGRGGRIFKISNLEDSGPGSLRECAEATVARVCLFEISGVIRLTKDINIDAPNLTIAGHTAPSPGIMIRGAGIRITTNDVLVQHLSVRVGDDLKGPSPENRDAIKIEGGPSVNNIVLDHVSVSWAIDENISIWGAGIHDITISNSIISEGLDESLHPKGAHSKGLIVGASAGGPEPTNISVVGNLFAHNFERNALMSNGTFANNFVYNWEWRASTIRGGDETFEAVSASVVGNVYKRGFDSNGELPVIIQDVKSGTQIYLFDNQMKGLDSGSPWSFADVKVSFDVRASSPQAWPSRFDAVESGNVIESVLANAGSRPTDRDAVDVRIIQDVEMGTGTVVDCISTCDATDQQVPGGWPTLESNRRLIEITQNPSADDDGDGYTNLEEQLHAYYAQVENYQFKTEPVPELLRPNPPANLTAE
jgi:hypothetical protein